MPAPRPTSSASTGTSVTKTRVANASRARSAATTTTTTSSSSSSTQTQKATSKISKRMSDRGVWSEEEHDKFLVGIKLYPKGPWKLIAAQVGTRSARQVQTHAQKYYEKVARRLRGLRKDRKKLVRPEHRLDDDMMSLCKVAEFDMSGARLTIGPIGRGLGVQSSLAASQADENAALAQVFASFSPSLSSKSAVALEILSTKLHGDTASAPTSPMGVDTVSSVKMQDIDDFVLDIEQDDYEEQDGQLQSFMSLLTNNGNVGNSTTYFAFDLGDSCSSTTSEESLGGDDDDDTTSSAGSDDTDSIVDLLDDHYLDYLMKVLDTEDQIDQICQADFSCSSYGFRST